jgi:hypothetical protein
MIVVEQQPGAATDRVVATVYAAFNIADFQEFETTVQTALAAQKPVDLLFDLLEMADWTLDVAIEDLRFAREHAQDFRRIAVVSDSQWVAWSAWLSRTFLSAEVDVFETVDEAKVWLDGE